MKTRVLIVEDEQDIAGVLSKLLQLKGFEVEVAYDGQEALDRLASFSPQVMLLDLMMPVKSGWDVCREVRGDPAQGDLVIIVTSAVVEPPGDPCSWDAFLRKPYDLGRLVRTIQDLLKARGRA